jgi:signal recognition particle receptor subunit beta
LPFVLAVNQFPATPQFADDAVRDALVLPPDTPVARMDARDPRSSQNTLVTLVEHALMRTPVG